MSPRPAWRPLHLVQPDLVGHSSAALQPHLLLCGIAACIAWRVALRVLRSCLRLLSLRPVTDVSSKKRALKLGGVDVKIGAKQRAKLVQERRPRFDDTPTPLAREDSIAAVSLQHCAASSVAQGREAPPVLKAVKRLSRWPGNPRLSASRGGSGKREIDFDLKIVPEKSSMKFEKNPPPEKLLGSAKMAEQSSNKRIWMTTRRLPPPQPWWGNWPR